MARYKKGSLNFYVKRNPILTKKPVILIYSTCTKNWIYAGFFSILISEGDKYIN